MIGEVWFIAMLVNSLATHTLSIDLSMYPLLNCWPGVPTNDGITTVKPAFTTSFANAVTAGVMPGISCTTITPGPLPRRYVAARESGGGEGALVPSGQDALRCSRSFQAPHCLEGSLCESFCSGLHRRKVEPLIAHGTV